MLDDPIDPEWRFYLLLCLLCFQELYVRFPVYKTVVQGLLAITMRNGLMTSAEAQEIMERFPLIGRHHQVSDEVNVAFTCDFRLALTAPDNAKLDALVQEFNELAVFDQYTWGDAAEWNEMQDEEADVTSG